MKNGRGRKFTATHLRVFHLSRRKTLGKNIFTRRLTCIRLFCFFVFFFHKSQLEVITRPKKKQTREENCPLGRLNQIFGPFRPNALFWGPLCFDPIFSFGGRGKEGELLTILLFKCWSSLSVNLLFAFSFFRLLY